MWEKLDRTYCTTNPHPRVLTVTPVHSSSACKYRTAACQITRERGGVQVRVYSLVSSAKRHSSDFTQLPPGHRTSSFISHLNSPGSIQPGCHFEREKGRERQRETETERRHHYLHGSLVQTFYYIPADISVSDTCTVNRSPARVCSLLPWNDIHHFWNYDRHNSV